jgi:adenylate cyclase
VTPDPPAGALSPDEMAEVVRAFGASDDEVRRAVADGTLSLLAIDRMALGQELRYDVGGASREANLPEDELRHIWRSLGFPDPPADEIVLTQVDVDNLAAVATLLHSGVIAPEVVYGMTRVVGSSMARVASALVDAVSARAEAAVRAGGDAGDAPAAVLAPLADEGSHFLLLFPAVLEQVWRRHLQAAARRRLLRTEGSDAAGLVVGFADLVGFTSLAQQISDEELAEVVDKFERLAYDVVVAGGGRVLKMIGDEVMFLVEDPVAAAEIALALAEASRDAAGLSDVRVGLALGPVLEREGDAYGPTVNLASRITAIAYPGSVVVSPELRAALEDDPAFSFRGMRPRFLKHIGRVSLAVMRDADDPPATIREAIGERRRHLRDTIRERITTRTVIMAGPDAQPEVDDAP